MPIMQTPHCTLIFFCKLFFLATVISGGCLSLRPKSESHSWKRPAARLIIGEKVSRFDPSKHRKPKREWQTHAELDNAKKASEWLFQLDLKRDDLTFELSGYLFTVIFFDDIGERICEVTIALSGELFVYRAATNSHGSSWSVEPLIGRDNQFVNRVYRFMEKERPDVLKLKSDQVEKWTGVPLLQYMHGERKTRDEESVTFELVDEIPEWVGH